MTDKVQRIREEVERLQKRAEHNFDISLTENERQYWLGEFNVLTLIGKYIDSLQEEPVSEDLEEAAKRYATEGDEISGLYIIDEEVDAFKAGAKWQIAKLMANATEVTVHIEAGNYPYIPQIELYDYDKDIPLAKEGDRYKVVLIKED